MAFFCGRCHTRGVSKPWALFGLLLGACGAGRPLPPASVAPVVAPRPLLGGLPDRLRDGGPCGEAIILDEIVSFQPLRFPRDLAVWLPEHDPLADDLARFIAEHPTLRGFLIVGHASPAERRAEWLAAQRASLVREELIARGVPEQLLLVQSGVGATPAELAAEGMNALQAVTFALPDGPLLAGPRCP